MLHIFLSLTLPAPMYPVYQNKEEPFISNSFEWKGQLMYLNVDIIHV